MEQSNSEFEIKQCIDAEHVPVIAKMYKLLLEFEKQKEHDYLFIYFSHFGTSPSETFKECMIMCAKNYNMQMDLWKVCG